MTLYCPVQDDGEDWISSLGRARRRMSNEAGRTASASSIAPARLHDAMRYVVLGSGKRARPLLAFAAGELTGAEPGRVCLAACAVELIHAYSLVHDDLPAMDDDDLRRGKPSCHREYDEATALLVGDALQSLAFEILSRPGLLTDASRQLAI
jgi:farnesyl diphosphate synthase